VTNSAVLPTNAVDVAFLCDTYHHFEFLEKTMLSLHRAIKPGGRLVVIDFHRIPGKTPEKMLNHVRAGQEVAEKESNHPANHVRSACGTPHSPGEPLRPRSQMHRSSSVAREIEELPQQR
jgi:SAM-dependent methyltransferase